MSKQRNKIIFAIVISMMISACGVKEDVQKERGTDEGLIEETESENIEYVVSRPMERL